MAKAKQVTVTEAPAEAPAEVRICGCGTCGLPVKPGRRFKPGHDARYKGALLKQFDAGDEAAGATLVTNGWKSQAELDERTAKAEAAAARKAEREAEKQTRAEAKAKAAKPAVAQEAG